MGQEGASCLALALAVHGPSVHAKAALVEVNSPYLTCCCSTYGAKAAGSTYSRDRGTRTPHNP